MVSSSLEGVLEIAAEAVGVYEFSFGKFEKRVCFYVNRVLSLALQIFLAIEKPGVGERLFVRCDHGEPASYHRRPARQHVCSASYV
jgi:hypothetical protein